MRLIHIVRVATLLVAVYCKEQMYRIVELAGQLFPDYAAGNAIRGRLLRPFLRKAGSRFQVSLGVRLATPRQLVFGDDVYIGNGCWINGAGGGVTFGNEVMLGPYVTMVSGNHTFRDGSARYTPGRPGAITIGSGTWIGAHAAVMAGVSVGRSCLIAAGAVVTRDLPDGAIAAGVPARIIGSTLHNTSTAMLDAANPA